MTSKTLPNNLQLKLLSWRATSLPTSDPDLLHADLTVQAPVLLSTTVVLWRPTHWRPSVSKVYTDTQKNELPERSLATKALASMVPWTKQPHISPNPLVRATVTSTASLPNLRLTSPLLIRTTRFSPHQALRNSPPNYAHSPTLPLAEIAWSTDTSECLTPNVKSWPRCFAIALLRKTFQPSGRQQLPS